MEPAQFFAASRLVIVAGKGGVGKTATTAALATAAARTGLRVLVLEVDGSAGLGAMFGAAPLAYAEATLRSHVGDAGTGVVRGRALTADAALRDYLGQHGLGRLSDRLARSGALDVVATAAPGIEDILLLGKVKQLERSGDDDLLVLDAPAAGHAISFLRSASGLLDAVRVGPVRNQALDVLELLTDPSRCSVVLVTLPEETPVNELVETAYALEDQVGVQLGPVVVNAVHATAAGLAVDPVEAAAAAGVELTADELEALRRAAAATRGRAELEQAQIARLAEQLPLPQLHLPALDAVGRRELGPDELEVLADAAMVGVAALAAAAP